MLGNEFELTHCLLLDLPEHADRDQLTQFISKRLNKIDFHGGVVTINVPGENVHFQVKNRWNIFKALFGKNEPELQAIISEQNVRLEWRSRFNLINRPVRLELEDYSLSLLEESIPRGEAVLFLNIGYLDSRITLAMDGKVLAHQHIHFSLDQLIPERYREDTGKRKELFDLLKFANIDFKNGKLIWQNNDSMEKIQDLSFHIEKWLHDFYDQLQKINRAFSENIALPVSKMRIVGAGGIYQWLHSYFSYKLHLPVEKLSPFSRMVKIGPDFNSAKLKEIESVFAPAMSLALSGAQTKSAYKRDVSKKVKWLIKDKNRYNSKFHIASLLIALFISVLFMIFSFQLDREYQQYIQLDFQHKDLAQQTRGLQNRVFLEKVLAEKKTKPDKLIRFSRYSPILKAVGEVIPNGAWITSLRIIPAAEYREFSLKRRRKKNNGFTLEIQGRAISASFITDFANKLKETGYFELLGVKRNQDQDDYIDSIPYLIFAKIKE